MVCLLNVLDYAPPHGEHTSGGYRAGHPGAGEADHVPLFHTFGGDGALKERDTEPETTHRRVNDAPAPGGSHWLRAAFSPTVAPLAALAGFRPESSPV